MCYRRRNPLSGRRRQPASGSRFGNGLSRRIPWLTGALALGVLVAPRAGGAAEVTRVVSALDSDNRFDFNLTLAWLREDKTAVIKREGQSDLNTHTELLKDLLFIQTRNVVNLRADF